MSVKTELCITDKTCHNCYKTFAGRSHLYRHLREVHNEYEKINSFYEKDECIFKCMEGCDVSFRFNRDLRHHLNGCHNFNILEITKQFSNLKDFYEWFLQVQENGAHFIKHRGSRTQKKKTTYYSCSRSGLSRIKINDRKRQPKKKGTRKINAGCTSYLKLEENDKYCEVTYCDFHYGHQIELEHLPLPLESRAVIVDKLANGAKLIKIDLKREDVEFESVQRSDLLTRSDVKNLKYFCKSKKAKLAVPKLTSGKVGSLDDQEDPLVTCPSEETEVLSDCNEDLNDVGNGNLKEHITTSENMIRTTQIKGINEDKEIEQNNDIEEQEEEVASGSDNENIEIHCLEDTGEISDTEEDVFGYYVAEMLKKIDPINRVAARGQIHQILQSFLIK